MGGGGGKKGGGSGDYYRYYMSLQAGIANQVDEISAVVMGDRAIWEGSVTQSQVINVKNEDLFGGPKREGGVNGAITFLMGEDHQFMPPYLLAKFGDVASLIPSYRGLTTLFFHEAVADIYDGALLGDLYEVGQDEAFAIEEVQSKAFIFGGGGSVISSEFLATINAATGVTNGAGFYFQANNPYLRELKVVCNRRAKGLMRSHSSIARGGGANDANPAHIIFELMTSRDFGSGLPISRINVESFELAAKTLYDEGFGISLKWISQGKVKDMILEVLDHINALLYEDPRTGLSTLKLLRDDYDEDDLPVADYDNCVVNSFQRKQEELVNEIIVTYTNPDSYEEATVTVQDLAGIAAEGGVVSTSRNYYGVHKTVLAKNLGERDLRAEGHPLATAEIDFFRDFWDIKPGMPIKVDSPEDSDEILIMRVMKVDDDSTGHGYVRATVVEDVFSLEAAPLFTTPDPIIEYDDTDPNEASAVQAFTMPYTLSVNAGLFTVGSDPYPQAHLCVLAASQQEGVGFYDLEGEIQGALGTDRFDVLATNTIIPRGVTASVLPAEVSSTFPLPSLSNGDFVEPEFLVVIGTGNEEDLEIAGVTALDANTGEVTLRRGILDTVPQEWPIGTAIWFMSTSSVFWDATNRSAFESSEFKVLPVAVGSTLASEDATQLSYTLTERVYLPFRPANVQLDGTGFGTLVALDRDPKTVTWANRYRQGEDAVILAWDAASVSPESGQTTEIEVLRASDRVVLNSYTGLTGTSYTLPKTAWAGETDVIVKVWSSRDGFRSLQGHEIGLELPEAPGYGNNYGAAWGG